MRPASPKAAKLRAVCGIDSEIEQLGRALWHEGLSQDGDLARNLGRGPQHGRHARGIGFAQVPWRLPGKITVGVRHHGPYGAEHQVELIGFHRFARPGQHAVGGVENGLVGRGQRAGLGHPALAVPGHHRERALREVAQIVGEVRVHARDDRLMAVIAVLAERHLTQEEIAQRIDAIGVGERERIDHVAHGLRHFLPAIEEKAVAEDAFGRRQARRKQERRPIDRVEAHNIFADHVQIRRPKLELRRLHIGIADAGEIIGERVDPHIHDVTRRIGRRHAPIERGARDREILQPTFDEADDFVEAALRQHEVRVVRVELEQPVLIGREAEEIGLLLGPLDRRALRADAHVVGADFGFAFGVVRLVAHRIPALIGADIDVAGLDHLSPDRLAGLVVSGLGGADEAVVGDVEPVAHLAEQRAVPVGERARRDPLLRGGLRHLHAVLVDSGHEEDVVAVEPLEARDRIGRDRLVGVADVRHAIRVGDRRGQVVARLGCHECDFLHAPL